MPARIRFVLPLLVLPVAVAAQALGAWDANRDGAVERAELETGLGLKGVFETWDADEDDLIDSREFVVGLHELWDIDGDGDLSVDEWQGAADAWFGANEADAAAWDDDGDGTLGGGEFAAAIAASELFVRTASAADPSELPGSFLPEVAGPELAAAEAEIGADTLRGTERCDTAGEPPISRAGGGISLAAEGGLGAVPRQHEI